MENNSNPNHNSKKDFGSLIIIFIFTFAAYYNSLFNNFTYDDKFIITQNYEFQNIHKIKSLFNNSYFAYSQELSYRPLVTFSYLIDYVFFGLKPFFFHLMNLLLHLIATLLLYVFVKQWIVGETYMRPPLSFVAPTLLSGKFTPEKDSGLQSASKSFLDSRFRGNDTLIPHYQLIPFFLALLFGVLTIHTENVCSVAYREDLLMTIFFLLAMIFAMISLDKERSDHLCSTTIFNKSNCLNYFVNILSGTMYFFALLSKESALSFLLFILIYHLSIYRIKFNKLLINYLPHILITIIYFFIRFVLMKNLMESQLLDNQNHLQLILVTPYILIKYILTTLIPIDLSANYSLNFQDKLLLYKIILSYLIIVLLLIISILIIRKEKIISFSILLFFCLLLPVANIFPLANPLAERYLYLPSISFCLFISYILICRFKKVGIYILILLIILNFILTIKRNKVWKNDLTLWTSEIQRMDTVYTTPTGNLFWDGIISRPYANLGIYYLENKKFDLASDYLENAYNFNKNSPRIISSLAISKYKSGHKTEAINILTNLNIDKLSPSNKVIIGDAFYDINDFENALKIYTQITSHNEDPKYKVKVAKTFISMGQAKTSIDKPLIQKGKEICANILQSDKYNFEAMTTLTIALYHLGDYKNAKEIGLNALKINNNIPYLYFILASIEEKLNNLGEAEKSYKRVVKLNPLEVDAYINLGTLYAHQGKNAKAKEWWEKGLLIEQNNKIIQENLKRLSEE